MGMIRVVRCTNAERLAYGGIEGGRLFYCTDTETMWMGTGSGDLIISNVAAEAVEFLDNFEDSARHWSWRDEAGNGSFTETSDYLQISVAGAAQADWWGGGACDCPRAIIGCLRHPQEIITKLTTCTVNGNTSAGVFITNNPLDGAADGYILQRNNDQKIGVDELGVGNIALTGAPVALPVWLRIRTIGHGNGNTTFFHYSTDGSAWTSLISVDDLEFRACGLFAKNFITWNAIDARFDFFNIIKDTGP